MYPAKVTSIGPIELGDRIRMTSELPSGSLTLGKNIEICSDCRIDFSGGLEIDDGTLLSSGVKIYTHSHGLEPRSDPIPTELHIGKEVWLGAGAAIMDSVSTIGNGAVIGAAAVLTKNVGDNEIWVGNPAKLIGKKE